MYNDSCCQFIICKLYFYFYIHLAIINFKLIIYDLRSCFSDGGDEERTGSEEETGQNRDTGTAVSQPGPQPNEGGKAYRAELSKGVISQVERELTSPAIATLMDILQCLGTTIGEFFTETADEQIVFGKNDFFIKEDGELKNTVKWIVPNAQKNCMEPILLTLEAGGSSCPDSPHEGEEFGYVLSGSIAIHLGNRVFRAKKGESFYFTSDKTHYIESKNGASLLWVSSPPSF